MSVINFLSSSTVVSKPSLHNMFTMDIDNPPLFVYGGGADIDSTFGDIMANYRQNIGKSFTCTATFADIAMLGGYFASPHCSKNPSHGPCEVGLDNTVHCEPVLCMPVLRAANVQVHTQVQGG